MDHANNKHFVWLTFQRPAGKFLWSGTKFCQSLLGLPTLLHRRRPDKWIWPGVALSQSSRHKWPCWSWWRYRSQRAQLAEASWDISLEQAQYHSHRIPAAARKHRASPDSIPKKFLAFEGMGDKVTLHGACIQRGEKMWSASVSAYQISPCSGSWKPNE